MRLTRRGEWLLTGAAFAVLVGFWTVSGLVH